MASLPTAPTTTKKGRAPRHHLRVDMTPLVDLGFLLITFFVFTSTLGSSTTMPLFMPKDGPPSTTAASTTLTLLASGNNTVYAYLGTWQDALQHTRVHKTNYSLSNGVGVFIRKQQAVLTAAGKDPNDLVLLIKPTDAASYRNLVDLLDEAVINGVTHYAVVTPDREETAFIDLR